MHPQAAIPSPTHSVWHLGPLPIRAYAVCIVAGIFVALYVAARRWRAKGGTDEDIWDVAGWAVAFGIVGGRLYHVVTDPELYFGSGKRPLDALKIWDGGLGIWGAIALGVLGAWIGCRRHSIRLTAFADAAIPGVALAQGIGRWGNWFNNELHGGPTSMPWKLQIHCWDLTAGHAVDCPAGNTTEGYFQPTFLYESIWDIALAVALIWAGRRWTLGRGNTFALYAMGYSVGRAWIEALRNDHANHILGLRLNDWTSLIVFVGALVWFLRHRDQPDESIYTADRAAAADASDTTEREADDAGPSAPDVDEGMPDPRSDSPEEEDSSVAAGDEAAEAVESEAREP